MIVGFDYGNTLTLPKVREMAGRLAHHDIYAVSAVKPNNAAFTRAKIEALDIPFAGIEVLAFDDWLDVPKLKLEACQRLGIELFIDDRLDTCVYLKMNGIIALYVV